MEPFKVTLESFVKQALDTANSALNRIDIHEKVCEERARGIEYQLKQMAEALLEKHTANVSRLDSLNKILWATAGGTIITLLAACGSMALLVFKH